LRGNMNFGFKKAAILALVTLLFALAKRQTHAQAGAPRTSGKILIQPRDGLDPAALSAWMATESVDSVRSHPGLRNLQVVQPRHHNEQEVIAKLQKSGLVEFAEPDYILTASVIPNDPSVVSETEWALNKISAPAAWDRVHSASNVIVAIVDSGLRITHQDLQSNLWTNTNEIPDNGIDDDGNGIIDDAHGFNGIDHSGDISDQAGHGTHVAGIIGAMGNNGVGVAGVTWQVQLMPLKFLDNTGEGSTSDAIACIDYARVHGASVINASWGGPGGSALRSAISRARSAGIIFVAAAGNDGVNTDRNPDYPASYTLDNVVSVGASDRNDSLASFSDYGGMSVDLLAPGVGIYSTWKTSDSAYVSLDGTSMATPFVTGAFALLKARFPAKTYRELITAVLSSVDKIPAASGKTVSGGRLNIAAALNQLSPYTAPALSLSRNSTTVTLTLTAEPDTQFTIQQSPDLIAWTPLGTISAAPKGPATTNIPNSNLPLNFFRIVTP
jgi:subtilisin family serine protease